MIICIPSKETVYTLVKDTVFKRNVLAFSDSATTVDKRFGSPDLMTDPNMCSYFNSFDFNVTVDGNIVPRLVENSILMQVILGDVTFSDITLYLQATLRSCTVITIRNKCVPTLGNLKFEFQHINKKLTIQNAKDLTKSHILDMDFDYISGIVVPAGTKIKFSGFNMAEGFKRIEIVDSPEDLLKPSKLMSPNNKRTFGSFSKKVTFDLNIDQLNGMEVV